MKKIVILGIVLFVMAFSLVSADTINSNQLTCDNFVCEQFFQEDMEIGDSASVTVNNDELVFKLKNIVDNEAVWDLNSHEGTAQEINNEHLSQMNLAYLKGGAIQSYVPYQENFAQIGIYEQRICPLDCVNEFTDTGTFQNLRLFSPGEFPEGWALISFNEQTRRKNFVVSERELTSEDILAEYYFIPTIQEYISEEDEPSPAQLEALEEYTEIAEDSEDFMAKMIYVGRTGNNKATAFEFTKFDFEIDKPVPLFNGWNLIGITPAFAFDEHGYDDEKSLLDVQGDCDLNAAYALIGSEWMEIPLDQEISSESIGLGIAVNVDGDCALSFDTSSSLVPPSMPN